MHKEGSLTRSYTVVMTISITAFACRTAVSETRLMQIEVTGSSFCRWSLLASDFSCWFFQILVFRVETCKHSFHGILWTRNTPGTNLLYDLFFAGVVVREKHVVNYWILWDIKVLMVALPIPNLIWDLDLADLRRSARRFLFLPDQLAIALQLSLFRLGSLELIILLRGA